MYLRLFSLAAYTIEMESFEPTRWERFAGIRIYYIYIYIYI